MPAIQIKKKIEPTDSYKRSCYKLIPGLWLLTGLAFVYPRGHLSDPSQNKEGQLLSRKKERERKRKERQGKERQEEERKEPSALYIPLVQAFTGQGWSDSILTYVLDCSFLLKHCSFSSYLWGTTLYKIQESTDWSTLLDAPS